MFPGAFQPVSSKLSTSFQQVSDRFPAGVEEEEEEEEEEEVSSRIPAGPRLRPAVASETE